MSIAANSDDPENPTNERERFLKQLDNFKSGIELIRNLMVEMESGHQRAETVLQDELRRKEALLQARDSAIRDLEETSSARIQDLGGQLSEKEELLKNRVGELETLRAEMSVLTGRLAEMESTYKRGESLLQKELNRRDEMLEAQDSTIRELDESLNAKVHALKSQVSEKEELLRNREGQLEALRSEVNALAGQLLEIESVNKRVESSLQDELRRKEEVIESKESTIRELEQGLGTKIRDLGSQVSDKEALLKGRDEELEGLKTQVNVLTGRLAETESAKEQAESLLQKELRRRDEMLQVRDSAIKIRELRESLSVKIHDRESQPGEKEQVDRFEIFLTKNR
jgi:DNA repair exonuclease SbcCD ATPase subunit